MNGILQQTDMACRFNAPVKPNTNRKGQVCGGLDLCSKETLEASMLMYSTPDSIRYSASFTQPLFVISHNLNVGGAA